MSSTSSPHADPAARDAGAPYRRRRRLALVAAVASAILLAVWFYVGAVPERFIDPVPVPASDALYVTHRAIKPPSEMPITYLLTLDPETLRVRERRLFYDSALAVAPTPAGLVAVFGTAYRPLASEERVNRLDQDWPVLVLAHERGTARLWLFGVGEDKKSLKARLLDGDKAGPVETVAENVNIHSLDATWTSRGPVVVWKVRDTEVLRVARRAGNAFERLADVPIGAAAHWATVAVGDRRLTLSFDRAQQSRTTLKVQVQCCPECGLAPPPESWSFEGRFQIPPLLVTGMGATVDGDRVRVVLARGTTLEAGSVPADTLVAAGDAALAPIHVEAVWRRYAALLVPAVLLFLSFTLVASGFLLLRERRAMLAVAGTAPAVTVASYADAMQRITAFLIDQMLVLPASYILLQAMGLTPDDPDVKLTDPRLLAGLAVAYGLSTVYFFIQEAMSGQTVGKRLVGIRVVDSGSDRLSVRRALVRNVLRIVDAYSVLAVVGLAAIMMTRRKQRIGDLVAGTVVVQSSSSA